MVVIAAVIIVAALIFYIRQLRVTNAQRRTSVLRSLGVQEPHKKKLVGFFHPYCNAGGGGERVLWTAVAFLQRTEPDVVSVVYSGDVDATKEQILAKVEARFAISLAPGTLEFVFLDSRRYVEDSAWPRFTLLGQSVGSMYLAWEAMSKLIPDLYIDTMGYAFTFHVVAWLTGVPIGAYVHYPTISTDMLARVQSRKKWHTNSDSISSSPILSRGKLLYYRLFMYHYAQALRRASFLMVNSSWTKNHVDSIIDYSDPILDAIHLPIATVAALLSFAIHPLLPRVSLNDALRTTPRQSTIVYPPCDTREMSTFALEGRERIVLSISQFRPEKDHQAQLRALAHLLREHPEYKSSSEDRVRLVLIGGSRNADDAARVESLRALAKELGVEDHVEFAVNAPYSDMLSYLARASVGLHTMVDEHFGISVVEFMAAGLIPVAHASGGPLHDIVVPVDGQITGYHATTPEAFATGIHAALTLPVDEELALRRRAREWAVGRFSEREFEKGWQGCGWRTWL
ncbi:glycosyltransferase family 4 protein [Heterobasidion irregulare TC 32-1]|uniref:GDP-Man:Man(3)GlcNAc(2)-PP-Dol alpha-1,2-mannosyltransferase n=1 Tax=Heterobasidion irregulare (strain TC 32-1) TaxID=747525 RepID=W4KA54_HETIT|nr:glycosyltransferase family 4 protein [Heterobasidion irregulare TC 32-1]ETW82230.1 glycosyltransferase family 4 protein [Heterobasidion irregulare TC 32-1]